MKQPAILIALLLVFGAINTIQLKLQNIHILDQNSGQKFFHPFMQTILLFIGESVVGIVYLINQILKERKDNQIGHSVKKNIVDANQKPNAPISSAFLPALMDMLSTLFSYMALNMVDSSVWQISRGGVIVTTAILSRFFLKRKFTSRAVLGCVLAFIGITSVQVVAVISSESSSTSTISQQLVGLCLLFVSILFNSFGLIIEKRVFDRYELHPLKMVFLQGVMGLGMMLVITFGFQFIQCPWTNKSQCVCIGPDQYYLDLASSNFLIFLTVGFICSIAISVPIGTILSKQVSPISRSLGNVSRTVLIWLFGIIMTFTYANDHPQYKLQSEDWLINLLKGVGFITLLIGTAFYHGKTTESKQMLTDAISANDFQNVEDDKSIKSITTVDSEQVKEYSISGDESLNESLIINGQTQ